MEKARCPLADECWKGGGSYSCVSSPPFCREPLIPKTPLLRRAMRQTSPISVAVEQALLAEPLPEQPVEPLQPVIPSIPIIAAISVAMPIPIQGELF